MAESDLSEMIWETENASVISVFKVKEFIKKQIDRMDERIEWLSQLDGLAEAMLQKAEVQKIKEDLINDAGKELS